MILFNEVNLKEMKWIQRSITQDELVSGNDVLGALHWANSWGSLASAESAYGKWTFKRVGFVHPKISIRTPDQKSNLHIAEVSWNGEATLKVLDQGTFRWTPNTWHTKWTLLDDNKKEVMKIELSGFLNVSGNLTVANPSIPYPTLSLLALLGWYLIMLVLQDDASSTAAIVATMN